MSSTERYMRRRGLLPAIYLIFTFCVVHLNHVPQVTGFVVGTQSSTDPKQGLPSPSKRPKGSWLNVLKKTSPLDTAKSNNDNNDKEEEQSAATLRSIVLCNILKDKEPELLCDFFMEIGACSASITDADRGTDLEQPLFSEPGIGDPWKDSLHWAAPIWNRCNVTAHFPFSIDLKGVIEMVAEVFPDQFPVDQYTIEQVPNKDWVVHVQSQWTPIVIPNTPFVLRFPWHTAKDIEECVQKDKRENNSNENSYNSVDHRIELKLQGGIAFGTGEHPTTQLCLEWIYQQVTGLVDNSIDNEILRIMDYGAGSGVLGLAACALGPGKVQSIGTDIDVDAIQIGNVNAKVNGLNMRNYLPPLMETADDESKSLLLKAHAHAKKRIQEESVDDVEEDGNDTSCLPRDIILPERMAQPIYDIAVANILAGPLVALSSTIASLVKPGGLLAMSGILPQQGDMVVEAYSEYFGDCRVQKEMGGWILVTGTRKTKAS